MSSYAQEVARRREAAIRREPVTGAQMGVGGILGGLGKLGFLGADAYSGGLLSALATRAQGGAALNPYQYPPMPIGMARPLGGRYAPRTPGLRAETLEDREEMMNFEGYKDWASVEPGSSAYNLRNEADEIVASANRTVYPAAQQRGRASKEAYVPSMWVREDYRKTPAMFDLYNLLSRGGKTPLRASFANARLRKVFEKRMVRQGKMDKEKLLDYPEQVRIAVERGQRHNASAIARRREEAMTENIARGEVPQQWVRPPRPGEESIVPERQLARQLTNKDVPSTRQMAPVRRPPTPRPARSPIAERIALERRAREQEQALLDARRAEYLKDVEKMLAQSRREAVIRRSGRNL